MSLWQAVLFGVVEGLTEFLPVSSTGHLILLAHLIQLPSTEFLKSFEMAIQVGAILAVLVLYGKRFLTSLEIVKKVLFAFLPTAIMGFFFYKTIKQVLMGDHWVVVAALFIGGVVLILFEKWHKEKSSSLEDVGQISYIQAFWIGLFQTMALIPGVSRSAATIIGGLSLGLRRKTIVEFSFLLAVPTLLAAVGLDLLKNGIQFSNDQWTTLAMGITVSFAVAVFSIRFFIRYIQNHNFVFFGIYRILVAFTFWIWIQ